METEVQRCHLLYPSSGPGLGQAAAGKAAAFPKRQVFRCNEHKIEVQGIIQPRRSGQTSLVESQLHEDQENRKSRSDDGDRSPDLVVEEVIPRQGCFHRCNATRTTRGMASVVMDLDSHIHL